MSMSGETMITNQYLMLRLDDRHYGLALEQVGRITRAAEVTPVPGLGAATLGVVNIQGVVLPVISLRRRLGLPDRPLAVTDQFIVAATARRPIVLVADGVYGV